MRIELARRKFWERVQQSPLGHWYWRGATVKGEGILTWEGTRQYAPRVAWKLTRGHLPRYLELVRTCPEEDCVRPAHHYRRCTRHRRPECPQCAGEYRANLILQLWEKLHGRRQATE